jgi:ribosomal protein S1
MKLMLSITNNKLFKILNLSYKYMDEYLNDLLNKYPINIKKKNFQKGGAIKDFKPIGGFPPIYLCSIEQKEDENVLKPRQYSTHKSAVSIKDIMKKRRDVVPVL